VQPSDYYPLLFLHVHSNEVGNRSAKVIKRIFRTSGWLVKESGAQTGLSSILPEERAILEGRCRPSSKTPICGSKTGVTSRILFFKSWGVLHNTRPACSWWTIPGRKEFLGMSYQGWLKVF